MAMIRGALLAAAAVFTLGAGPVSKFDKRAPEASFTSSAKLEDVERCLIDMDGWIAPVVYRQPDRPDAVTLLWSNPNGLTAARIDLLRVPGGTSVRSWMPAKQVRTCAP